MNLWIPWVATSADSLPDNLTPDTKVFVKLHCGEIYETAYQAREFMWQVCYGGTIIAYKIAEEQP